MYLQVQTLLMQFLEKNLFERLILYVFLSAFLTTFIFTVLLGEWGFVQSQNQQWFFFSFLLLDHLASYKKIVNLKITINPVSIFALTILVMVCHGLFIGIMNGNKPFVIFNDTVPLLMIALNVLRMQSLEETKNPIDIKFLLVVVTVLTGLTTLVGLPTGNNSIGNGTVFYALMFACLFVLRPLPYWVPIALIVITALNIGSFNRSTLLLIASIPMGYLAVNLFTNPVKSLLIAVIIVLSTVTFWVFLPEDTGTYRRIKAIPTLDLSARKGSIGERQQEQDQVNFTLQKMGPASEWAGLGFGGLYEAQFTHEYVRDYGHAHYAWVWFNLRFGHIGMLYMAFMFFIIFYNGFRSLIFKNELGLLVAFMCLSSFIYMFTYVNAFWLLSGLPMLYMHKEKTK